MNCIKKGITPKNIKPSGYFPRCNITYLFTFQTCFQGCLLKISNKTCNSAKKCGKILLGNTIFSCSFAPFFQITFCTVSCLAHGFIICSEPLLFILQKIFALCLIQKYISTVFGIQGTAFLSKIF